MANDYRQEFTDKLIASIGSGEKLPWEKPWAGGISPRNAITDAPYRSMNRMILGAEMADKGYSDSRFVTFKQAIDLGGAVKQGETGTTLERWDKTPFYLRKDVDVYNGTSQVKVKGVTGTLAQLADGGTAPTKTLRVEHAGESCTWASAEQTLSKAYSKTFTVFNVEQCNGLRLAPLVVTPPTAIEKEARVQQIENAMRHDGLTVQTKGVSAYYSPSDDKVVVPDPSRFKDVGGYQSTLLHEIGHATGAPHRLHRDGISGGHAFGSTAYAKEELRAELFSAFIAMETGINRARDEHHTAYLQSWLTTLKNDKSEIFKASADADKAVQYVYEREKQLQLYTSHNVPYRADLPRITDEPTRTQSMDELRQVTGRFGGYKETVKVDAVLLNVTRAGSTITVDLPKSALKDIPQGYKVGEPIKLDYTPKQGVTITTGRSKERNERNGRSEIGI